MSEDKPASASTYFPGSPRGSAPARDAAQVQAELSAASTRGRTAPIKLAAEKRSAKRARAKERQQALAAMDRTLAKVARGQEAERLTTLVDSIALRGLEHAAGLFKKPGEDGYNADADVPLPDATTRTHFGMTVYKQMMAQRREGMATDRALGVVVLQARMKSEEEWNAEARRVDEEQRRAQAIDVAAEMLAEEEP